MRTIINTLAMSTVIIGIPLVMESVRAGTLISGETEPYTVPGSQVHNYYSDIVQQEYELRVRLPDNYRSDSDKTYPVIYVLDGQWYFTLLADIAGSVAYDNQVAEAVVAAITWGGEGADPGALRARDFTPTSVPQVPDSGGAASFLAALETEIIPFIEGTYRTNGRRVIAGSSYGGLFVTYSLLEKPRLFDGYVALGATVNWDDNYLYERLDSIDHYHFPKGVDYYFGFGELDPGVEQFREFKKAFHRRHFRRVDFKAEIIDRVAHSSVNPGGFTYGLMHTLERPRIRLWWHQLQAYAGTYDLGILNFPHVTVEVMRGGLRLNIPGQPSFDLYPETPTLFYADGAPIEAKFDRGSGDGWSMTVTADGNVFNAVKID